MGQQLWKSFWFLVSGEFWTQIFVLPLPVVIGITLLLALAGLAWLLLKPYITSEMARIVRQQQLSKSQAKRLLRSLPRIILGLAVSLAVIWFSYTFLYWRRVQNIANHLTRIERAYLQEHYLLSYLNRNISHDLPPILRSAKIIAEIPDDFVTPLLLHAHETGIEYGLIKDSPYKRTTLSRTGPKKDSAHLPVPTGVKLTSLGIDVASYLSHHDLELKLPEY